MSITILGDLLGTVGAPWLKRAVEGALPPPFNQVDSYAIELLAKKLGTAPTAEAIVQRYNLDPLAAETAIHELELSPELIFAGVEQQREANRLQLAEMDQGPLWTWAWRPAGMWGLGALWMWNVIVLHVLNAIFKIALPPMDLWVLLQLSALYMGLYMGGHTVKDFVEKKWGRT